MVYIFFVKKASATCANKLAGGAIKSEDFSKQQLAEELQSQLLENLKTRKV